MNLIKKTAGRPKDTSKRENIVKAATTLFMRNGYTLTSMDAVAKKANVSKLTIYSHFANKDDLFKEVMQVRCNKVAIPGCYMHMSEVPVEKALQEIGMKYCKLIFTKDSIRLHSIMQAEASRHPQVVRIFFEVGPRRVRESFDNLLQFWNQENKTRITDTVKATEQFFSLLKGEMLMKVMLLQNSIPNEAEITYHVNSAVNVFISAYSSK